MQPRPILEADLLYPVDITNRLVFADPQSQNAMTCIYQTSTVLLQGTQARKLVAAGLRIAPALPSVTTALSNDARALLWEIVKSAVTEQRPRTSTWIDTTGVRPLILALRLNWTRPGTYEPDTTRAQRLIARLLQLNVLCEITPGQYTTPQIANVAGAQLSSQDTPKQLTLDDFEQGTMR